LGRGEEGDDDDDWPASPISSRLLFFDAPVFELFVRDAFILQVMMSSLTFTWGLRREQTVAAQVELIYLVVAAIA
jgi:hypothetical protein